MGNVTVFDTFFMMVAVIPVSKMLSSIFMKMAVRAGTVNQEKWAAIGLGTLGGVTMLMTRRGMMGGVSRSGQRQPNMDKRQSVVDDFNNNDPSGGGSARPSASGPIPGSGGGSAATNQGQQSGGGVRFSAQPGPGGKVRYSARPANQTQQSSSGPASGASGPIPGTVPPIGSTAENKGQQSESKDNNKNEAEIGQRSLQDIIDHSSKRSNKYAKGAAVFGGLSSFAAPEVAPIMTGVFGAAGKASTGFASTAYHIASEIKSRKKNGQNFSTALQEMAGSKNMVAATLKTSATLAMSPLGARATNAGMWAGRQGMKAAGRAYQWARDKGS